MSNGTQGKSSEEKLARLDRQKCNSRGGKLREVAEPGRLPPHSIEAEVCVLGSILLAPNECIPTCIAKIKSSEVFYDLRHRTIYETIVEMYDANTPVDLISLQQKLKDKGVLDSVGGVPYLLGLPDAVPSAANLEYYLDIICQKYVLRRLLDTCMKIEKRVYEHDGETDELLDEVEKEILRVSEERVDSGASSMSELVPRVISMIDEFHKRGGAVVGIPTGYRDLDNMTGGLHPGEMIVIAARPSVGKTSLAMNIAEHVAVVQGLPVGVFSLEMTAESLVLRMLCSRARVNARNLQRGIISTTDSHRLTNATGELARAPLYIDDSPSLTILQLRARARRMWQQRGIKLFVIDYLQLLRSTGRRIENRQQEIADISSGIKALAKELKVPVIVLSQLNRDVERDRNRKPRLSDLRESGAIEQDADVVGLLYRADPDDPNQPARDDEDLADMDVQPVNLYIAKQRNGPTGDIHLTFFRSFTRFEQATTVYTEDAVPY